MAIIKQVALMVFLASVSAFLLGYLVGVLQPRQPTFSESVYKQSEISQLKHDKRCEDTKNHANNKQNL